MIHFRSFALRMAIALAVVFSASMLTTSAVHAQPNTPAQAKAKAKAKALFKQAVTQYNLGNWSKAIEYYTLSYEAYPEPALLFNIGQAHRQAENCEKAIFFYKRYLANKPNAKNKKDVEEIIAAQKKACEAKAKDPVGPIGPDGGVAEGDGEGAGDGDGDGTGTTGDGDGTTTGDGTGTTGDGTGTTGDGTGTTGDGTGTTGDGGTTVAAGDDDDDDDDDIGISKGVERPGATLISARAAMGASFVSFGDPALKTDPLFALVAGAGYPIQLQEGLTVELGGLLSYTPIPWENAAQMSGTASLFGLLANASGVYEIAAVPGLAARADVGLGVQFFGGLGTPGTPFLEADESSDAPLTTFHTRLAVGAEYAVTPNIQVHAYPLVFGYSPKGQLRETISAVTRFDLLVGVGYRM